MTQKELDLKSIRSAILHLCKAYFDAAEKTPFVPGTTYIPATAKCLDAADLCHCVDASLDMWLTGGRFSRELESRLSPLFGRQTSAVLVNSGSSANLLALSALGAETASQAGLTPLKAGDEIITVAAGFPTTVNPIFQNGWTPVFVDIESATLNTTLERLKEAQSPKTRAVILAHTLGNPYSADTIARWCTENEYILIEDCCDALGAEVGGQRVGSFGHYATVSFYPAHHITMGEGGAVIAANGKLKRLAESLRDWGRDCWCETGKDNTCGKRFGWELGELPCGYDHKYIYSNVGYNLKVTDMQAAIGLSQLDKVKVFIDQRRKNWMTLNNAVKSSPLLNERLTVVAPTPNTCPSWFGFAMLCQPGVNRLKLTQSLEERKVGTRLVFGGNLLCQPAYQNKTYRVVGDLPETNRVMHQAFWIGVHPRLGQVELEYMVENLEACLKLQ